MDSALQAIDAGLMNVQQLLGSYNLSLIDKQEKLQRLEKALNELTNTKAALDAMKNDYLKPEFTTETFAGKNSNQFNDFRHGFLADSFAQFAETEMNRRIEDIQRQMDVYKSEIDHVEATISSLESQQKELRTQREKEITIEER